jgi:hypothetical protein
MRSKLFLILALVVALAATAAAQTKTIGTVSCAKPAPEYSIEVGDQAGHALAISKSACTWTKPMEIAGLKAKDGFDITYGDASGAQVQGSGYHVGSMANGDKFYVKFQGNDTTKDGKPATTEGTWSYTGGTGKLKGIKGKGTYKGKADAAGNMIVEVKGDYTLPAAKK